MGNTHMRQAKKNKNDEFYTRLADIEKELKYYAPQFKDKIVYCNCDDPSGDSVNMDGGSNFWNYFFTQFEHLGLKKLIATYYNKDGTSYKTEYKGGGKDKIIRTPLKGNGDFRSEECIEILKTSDIVCTNPPFSLFREYITQLIEYEKEFLVVGHFIAITGKEIFSLMIEEKMQYGYSPHIAAFVQPDGTEKKVNAVWYTNLEVHRRKEPTKLCHTYEGNEEKYPKYDNYDAIEVSRVKDIPKDYEGIMGVPVTYLPKHSPAQFEIIGLATPRPHLQPNKQYKGLMTIDKNGNETKGAPINSAMAIKIDKPLIGKKYYRDEDNNFYMVPFKRIFIKNKFPEKGVKNDGK